jgi:thioredoxin-dependent peroxiredoxin
MGRTGRLLSRALVACGLLATSGIGTNASMIAEELKVGDQAPDFTLPGTDGKTYTLSALQGQYVVLAWFPKAFTGG